MMTALTLASARLSKLKILCLNDLLNEALCKNFFYFHIFSFWFSHMILSDALILPVMSSQIRSHIEYLNSAACGVVYAHFGDTTSPRVYKNAHCKC